MSQATQPLTVFRGRPTHVEIHDRSLIKLHKTKKIFSFRGIQFQFRANRPKPDKRNNPDKLRFRDYNSLPRTLRTSCGCTIGMKVSIPVPGSKDPRYNQPRYFRSACIHENLVPPPPTNDDPIRFDEDVGDLEEEEEDLDMDMNILPPPPANGPPIEIFSTKELISDEPQHRFEIIVKVPRYYGLLCVEHKQIWLEWGPKDERKGDYFLVGDTFWEGEVCINLKIDPRRQVFGQVDISIPLCKDNFRIDVSKNGEIYIPEPKSSAIRKNEQKLKSGHKRPRGESGVKDSKIIEIVQSSGPVDRKVDVNVYFRLSDFDARYRFHAGRVSPTVVLFGGKEANFLEPEPTTVEFFSSRIKELMMKDARYQNLEYATHAMHVTVPIGDRSELVPVRIYANSLIASTEPQKGYLYRPKEGRRKEEVAETVNQSIDEDFGLGIDPDGRQEEDDSVTPMTPLSEIMPEFNFQDLELPTLFDSYCEVEEMEDSFGANVLFYLVAQNRIGRVKWFAEKGWDLSKKDDFGISLIEVAKFFKLDDMLKFLESKEQEREREREANEREQESTIKNEMRNLEIKILCSSFACKSPVTLKDDKIYHHCKGVSETFHHNGTEVEKMSIYHQKDEILHRLDVNVLGSIRNGNKFRCRECDAMYEGSVARMRSKTLIFVPVETVTV